jgi:hypothetical protein
VALGIATAVPLCVGVAALLPDRLAVLYYWAIFLGPAAYALLLCSTLPAIRRRPNPFKAPTDQRYA